MKFFTASARRSAILVGFFLAAIVIYLYLLTGTGFRIPLVQSGGYTASVRFDDVDNLVPASQVQMAGVRVGEVREVEHEGDQIRVTFRLDDEVAPLHEGAKVRLGERSLIGESYLDIDDGDGEEIPEGKALAADAAVPSTQLHDILADLDPQARSDLRGFVQSAAQATGGTEADMDRMLTGLGRLGREGHTALDAISAQSEDLRSLARQTTVLLDALDTGEGQIVTMVHNANRLTRATSGQADSVARTMRALPGVMRSARSGSASLNVLSESLGPVAKDLRVAGPGLSDALHELPAATREIRAMIPPFEGTLDRLPATLELIPAFDKDVRGIVTPADELLRDVNPMLAYLRPYGPEFASFFANYNAALQYKDEAGLHYIRLIPHINEHSPQSPIQTDGLYATYNNPMPPAGAGAKPGPFKGEYPRLERDPE